ncbi:MAG: hypothetical protein KKD28_12770, partial [Chloroflexi bacterium]|nr:hypothetical protein [Chloroflexota bacterium]
MKISLLCPFLSGNALGRAFFLAKVLERHYEVEIVGPVSDIGIWQPVKHENCKYVGVNIKQGWRNFGIIQSLLSQVTGDVIYASKPLLTSFGVGISGKFRNKTPLILDIDDWEYGAFFRWNMLQRLKSCLKLSTQRLDAYYPFTWFMYQLTSYADVVTVSSTFLQQKYGGT